MESRRSRFPEPGPAGESSPGWPSLNREARTRFVRRFFDRRAERYDEIADRPYWRYCDQLLLNLMRRTVLGHCAERKAFRFLDAGGGTGLWAVRILDSFPRSEGVLVDFSAPMLEAAAARARDSRLADRLVLAKGDLHDPIDPSLGLFDLALCFHNVASLVSDPMGLLRRLHDRVRPGGSIALVVPNRYQAAWLAIRDGRLSELRRITARSVVRYRPGFPDVLLFNPTVVREMLQAVRCRDVHVYGFPVSLPPTRDDAELPKTLRSESAMKAALRWDSELCLEEESASRGHNLLAFGTVAQSKRSR